MSQTGPVSESQVTEPNRRGFFVRAFAVLAGGLAALVPIASGIYVFLSPLRRRKPQNDFVRVAPLEAVPADGVPRRFAVVAERTDVWSHYPAEPIGAVYLCRDKEERVTALNVACPHAGCFVVFDSAATLYRCPCHSSVFKVDGSRNNPAKTPSPRSLDTLECEVRASNDGEEVWVRFENFRAGTPKKVPV